MKLITIIMAMTFVTVAVLGRSHEVRDLAVSRIERAWNELRGREVVASAPDIVKAQQRREELRRNTQWTPENQVRYPVEYCQAQLENIAGYDRQLEVQRHVLETTRAACVRQIGDEKGQIASLRRFLGTAKRLYRKAEETGVWPMVVNGIELQQESAKTRIVEAARQISCHCDALIDAEANLSRLERKLCGINEEQRNLGRMRERIEATIVDLRTRQVVDGQCEIGAAIGAINDSLSALLEDRAEVPLDELVQPNQKSEQESVFRQIMSEN